MSLSCIWLIAACCRCQSSSNPVHTSARLSTYIHVQTHRTDQSWLEAESKRMMSHSFELPKIRCYLSSVVPYFLVCYDLSCTFNFRFLVTLTWWVYFWLLRVCLQYTIYFSWRQTCLWGRRGNYICLFISPCCFIMLVFELEHLFFRSGAGTVSTQGPIKLNMRTITLLLPCILVLCLSQLQNSRRPREEWSDSFCIAN